MEEGRKEIRKRKEESEGMNKGGRGGTEGEQKRGREMGSMALPRLIASGQEIPSILYAYPFLFACFLSSFAQCAGTGSSFLFLNGYVCWRRVFSGSPSFCLPVFIALFPCPANGPV